MEAAVHFTNILIAHRVSGTSIPVWRRAPRIQRGYAILCSPVTEMPVTVKLQCQNCGFTFVITSSAGVPDATPLACGQCRSTRWSSNSS